MKSPLSFFPARRQRQSKRYANGERRWLGCDNRRECRGVRIGVGPGLNDEVHRPLTGWAISKFNKRSAPSHYHVIQSITSEFCRIVVGMAKAQHAPRYRHLPAMLRSLREEAGLTQRQLAAKLRTSHVFVHKSEIGERRVDIAEFMDFCLACGVDPEKAFAELRRLRGV